MTVRGSIGGSSRSRWLTAVRIECIIEGHLQRQENGDVHRHQPVQPEPGVGDPPLRMDHWQ
eukprot:1596111-Prymnesium_polylepis.1